MVPRPRRLLTGATPLLKPAHTLRLAPTLTHTHLHVLQQTGSHGKVPAALLLQK